MERPDNIFTEETQDSLPQHDVVPSEPVRDHWLRRNWKKIIIGTTFAASGAYLLSQPAELSKSVGKMEINDNIAYEVFPATEGCAWLGAVLMMTSAGKKMGNPLTVKTRLSQIKSELDDNKLFRAGWTLGAVGAVGTSATVAIGSVVTLPDSSWPLAFGVSAASLAFSTIPFRPNRARGEVK